MPGDETSTAPAWAWIAGGAAAAAVTCSFAYLARVLVRRRRVERVLKEYRAGLLLPAQKMKEIRDDMLLQAQAALRGEKQSLLMLPSMVDVLPEGNETGEVYAVDIGGTNFRVLRLSLSRKRGQVESRELRDFPIPERYFTCHMDELFDLLAIKLVEFFKERERSPNKPVVGFCFSFPVEQTGLAAGTLIRLTKSFENEGAVGADPVQQLQAALQRQGCPANVSVLLNDATGTFAGGRYMDEDVMIGVILGTGTNACYLEKRCNIRNAVLPEPANSDSMLINTEWGGFYSDSLPLLEEDRTLDWESVNAGEAIYEKMVSGLYMGEIARLILVQLVERGGLLGGVVPPLMRQAGALPSRHMAKMHADASLWRSEVAATMSELFGTGPWQMTLFERRQVQEVCQLVCRRSAWLIAVGIAALLKQMGRDGSKGPAPRTAVVLDGGVAEHFAAHRELVRTGLRELLGGSAAARIAMNTVREASSMGSAYLAAAVAARAESKTLPRSPKSTR